MLSSLPLRLLVILLGRLLPLLQSTAKAQHVVSCTAYSAEISGLRQYRLLSRPTITNLGHFHPDRRPAQDSKPDGNTRFPPGTLILLERPCPRSSSSHDNVLIAANRGRCGFTYSIEPLAPSPKRDVSKPRHCKWLTLIDTVPMPYLTKVGGRMDVRDTGCSGSLFMMRTAIRAASETRAPGSVPMTRTRQPHGASRATSLTPDSLSSRHARRGSSFPRSRCMSPWWRQPPFKHFYLRLRHVMRVGHLESPMAWRSLLYPSPAGFLWNGE